MTEPSVPDIAPLAFTTLDFDVVMASHLQAFIAVWEQRWVEIEAQRWVLLRIGLPIGDLDEEQATILRLHRDALAVIGMHRAAAVRCT